MIFKLIKYKQKQKNRCHISRKINLCQCTRKYTTHNYLLNFEQTNLKMERRRFIQSMSLATAGIYINGISAATEKSKILGLQLYSIRDAIAKNLESSLEKLASLGYKNLEIYGYNETFFGKSPAEFNTILSNTGLKVISSHHNAGIINSEKGNLTNNWAKTVESVDAIGAKYMVCAYLFPEERTSEIYKSLPNLLEKCGQATKDAEIQFAYHNHDFEFEKLENTLVYDFLLENTNPDLVQMELDLYWITKAGYDPLAYFEKYPGRFPLWHVKDLDAKTKDFTEVGNGIINFDRIFAARKKAGLQHWFVEQDDSKRDIFNSLKISKMYLDRKNY